MIDPVQTALADLQAHAVQWGAAVVSLVLLVLALWLGIAFLKRAALGEGDGPIGPRGENGYFDSVWRDT